MRRVVELVVVATGFELLLLLLKFVQVGLQEVNGHLAELCVGFEFLLFEPTTKKFFFVCWCLKQNGGTTNNGKNNSNK